MRESRARAIADLIREYQDADRDIRDLAVKARLHQLLTEHSDDPQGRDVILAGIEHLVSCAAA